MTKVQIDWAPGSRRLLGLSIVLLLCVRAETVCVVQNHLLLPNKLALEANKAHVAREVILRHSVLLIQLVVVVELLLIRSVRVGARADRFWLHENRFGRATGPLMQLVLRRSRVNALDLAATVCLSRRWLQGVGVSSLRVEACRLFLHKV